MARAPATFARVAAVLGALVVTLLATAAVAREAGVVPAVLWSNTNSLTEIGSTSPADVLSTDRFATIVQRLVVRDVGDFLVINDGPLPTQGRRNSHLRALRPALNVAASQTAFGAVYDSPDAPIAEAVAASFRRVDAPFALKLVQSEQDLAGLARRSAGKPTVYQVDLNRFQNAEAALRTIVEAFGQGSAPFVGLYVSTPQPSIVSESKPAQMRSFRGRELRAIPEDLLVDAADDDLKIMDRYTFVSPAIWMGLLAVVIFILILVPAILCTMEIQAPTQFEKKPLVNTAQ